MEENPAAAPTGTEENQTTNQEASTAPTANIPAEQIEAFNKFVAGQGGFENAFTKWKELVSNPQPKVEEKPVDTKPVEVAKPQEPKTPEGYITPQEFYAQQYFNSLSNDEKYAGIADAIRSGDILKEMAGFNINPLDANGNINDSMVRRFLDLKAQTVPAKSQVLEPTSTTPTVSYTNVGDEITSREDALKVLSEAGHPKHDSALEFLRKDIWKK